MTSQVMSGTTGTIVIADRSGSGQSAYSGQHRRDEGLQKDDHRRGHDERLPAWRCAGVVETVDDVPYGAARRLLKQAPAEKAWERSGVGPTGGTPPRGRPSPCAPTTTVTGLGLWSVDVMTFNVR